MEFSSRWRKHAHGTKRAPEWHAGTPRRRTLVKAPKQAVNQRLEQRRAAVGGNRQAVRGGFNLHRPDHPAWNNGITYVALGTPRPPLSPAFFARKHMPAARVAPHLQLMC